MSIAMPPPSRSVGARSASLDRRIATLTAEQRALLARRLAERREGDSTTVRPARRGLDGPCPLSSSQHRLWFLDQLEQGNPAYNVYRAVRIRGALDRPALAWSLGEIVRRHEILRTTFPAEGGSPVQVVHGDHDVPLPTVDLSGLPAEEREVQVLRWAFAEAHRRFDLARGPMIRATLVRLGHEEHVLLLTCHHIVADGWSVGILFRELTFFYEAAVEGRDAAMPELSIQYSDYAVWQQRWLDSTAYRSQVAYWKERLGNPTPPLALPTNHPRTALESTKGRRHFMKMSRSLYEGQVALARQSGATPFMALLATFQSLLYLYTGQTDIAVGSPVAGRDHPETEGLIGCFSNTLVLRTEFGGEPTFRQVLVRVREVALGAFAHRDIPFERLVRELRPARDPSRMTFFQVNFRVLTAPLPPRRIGPLTLDFLEVDNRRAKFDLSVELWETPEALGGYIEYYTDLYEASTIRAMGEDYESLLRAVIDKPDVPLEAIGVALHLASGRPDHRAMGIQPGRSKRLKPGIVGRRKVSYPWGPVEVEGNRSPVEDHRPEVRPRGAVAREGGLLGSARRRIAARLENRGPGAAGGPERAGRDG
jgi:hypothetical protein